MKNTNNKNKKISSRKRILNIVHMINLPFKKITLSVLNSLIWVLILNKDLDHFY